MSGAEQLGTTEVWTSLLWSCTTRYPSLGRFVCRMFCAGEMPFDTVNGEAERLSADEMDTSVGQPDFELKTVHRFGASAPLCRVHGQLLTRLVWRACVQTRTSASGALSGMRAMSSTAWSGLIGKRRLGRCFAGGRCGSPGR